MAVLRGNWEAKEVSLLNKVLKWWDWCEYSDFLPSLWFSKEGEAIKFSWESNKIMFDEIVLIAANGLNTPATEAYPGWDEMILQSREGFEQTAQDALQKVMEEKKLSIDFFVTENCECDDTGFIVKRYRLIGREGIFDFEIESLDEIETEFVDESEQEALLRCMKECEEKYETAKRDTLESEKQEEA